MVSETLVSYRLYPLPMLALAIAIPSASEGEHVGAILSSMTLNVGLALQQGLAHGSVLEGVMPCRVEVITMTVSPICSHSGLFGGFHGLDLNQFFCFEPWFNQSLPRVPALMQDQPTS